MYIYINIYIYIYIVVRFPTINTQIHANVKYIRSLIKQGFSQFSELSVKIAECPVKLRKSQEL